MKEKTTTQRRQFIKKTLVAGASAMLLPGLLTAETPEATNEITENITGRAAEGKDITILFQGDSITDGNRTRNNDWNHIMGHGYQYILSSSLWYRFPEKNFHFFNRGVSGNKVTDLAARWKEDTLNLTPDVISILIGINDVQSVMNDSPDKVDSINYENEYRALLHQTKERLPSVELILCEPFILPLGHTKDNYQKWLEEIQKRQASVRTLSKEFDAVYVDFQDVFNDALKRAPVEYWIWDGIHPMPAGHELMARQWTKQVHKKLSFIK